MSYIRIDKDVFEVTDISIQTSICSHATIYISLDIQKYPNCINYFSNIYDNLISFDLIGYSFICHNSMIKALDIEFNKIMNLTIRCDVLKDVSDRRDEVIEKILNKN